MITLSKDHIEQFNSGKVGFAYLRTLLYPLLTTEELCRGLGLAKPEFIVAIRSVFNGWSEYDHDRITAAQQLYDAGIIELVTARTQFNFILYKIIRKSPAKPRMYFKCLNPF